MQWEKKGREINLQSQQHQTVQTQVLSTKRGGSMDPGSSRVPWKTPALLATGKERPRIAQAHPLEETQELPCAVGKEGMSGERSREADLKILPNTIKRTWISSTM